MKKTSSDPKQHALRAYHTIQQWNVVSLNQTDWGWHLINEVLKPKYTDCEPTPEKLTDRIYCGCTEGRCGDNRCACRNAAIKCSIMCKNCNGIDCNNSTTAEA